MADGELPNVFHTEQYQKQLQAEQSFSAMDLENSAARRFDSGGQGIKAAKLESAVSAGPAAWMIFHQVRYGGDPTSRLNNMGVLGRHKSHYRPPEVTIPMLGPPPAHAPVTLHGRFTGTFGTRWKEISTMTDYPRPQRSETDANKPAIRRPRRGEVLDGDGWSFDPHRIGPWESGDPILRHNFPGQTPGERIEQDLVSDGVSGPRFFASSSQVVPGSLTPRSSVAPASSRGRTHLYTLAYLLTGRASNEEDDSEEHGSRTWGYFQ